MEAYLEIGRKRVFAGALEWPGWCRSGRDEQAALDVLIEYRPRYARVVAGLELPEPAPLEIVERLAGDATTDFGAPGAIPAADLSALDETELDRLMAVLERCWSAFDAAVEAARGRELVRGPRGGGRRLEAIVDHVREADESYARKVGGRGNFRQALLARWRGEVADTGPRGGARWPPRYAIRRAAWHVLDHTWELEDRLTPG